jgi:hypothetical protein
MKSSAINLVLLEISTQVSHDLFINTDPYSFIYHINLNLLFFSFFYVHLKSSYNDLNSVNDTIKYKFLAIQMSSVSNTIGNVYRFLKYDMFMRRRFST